MKPYVIFSALVVVVSLSGCHGAPSLTAAPSQSSMAQRQQVLDGQRAELDLIPPPSKNRYLAVHALETWENPYITVQAEMVTLHVMLADANPSPMGVGGIMRPVGARRQDLNVTLDKLGDALSAVPHTAWPYGRVAAIEEAHKTPVSAQPAVRRNMEATMKTLNELGIVVYEWNEPAAH